MERNPYRTNLSGFHRCWNMLSHCAANNRFAILDVPQNGNAEDFRTKVGNNFLAYGAAYYPWLRTTVLSDNDIDGEVMNLETEFEGKTGDLL